MAIAAIASGPDDMSDLDPFQDISYRDYPATTMADGSILRGVCIAVI